MMESTTGGSECLERIKRTVESLVIMIIFNIIVEAINNVQETLKCSVETWYFQRNYILCLPQTCKHANKSSRMVLSFIDFVIIFKMILLWNENLPHEISHLARKFSKIIRVQLILLKSWLFDTNHLGEFIDQKIISPHFNFFHPNF